MTHIEEMLSEDPLPKPDFSECGNCGADAQEWVVWDPGDGWSCNRCFATDGGD